MARGGRRPPLASVARAAAPPAEIADDLWYETPDRAWWLRPFHDGLCGKQHVDAVRTGVQGFGPNVHAGGAVEPDGAVWWRDFNGAAQIARSTADELEPTGQRASTCLECGVVCCPFCPQDLPERHTVTCPTLRGRR